MYSMVNIVTGPELTLVRVLESVFITASVWSNKVLVVVVFTKNVV